ncbi:zinc metallopeptidase [Ihubacter sp. rT4E-8]|uniref:zinc metallopeptidase n=1 Tax=unclassified Ihubacter TaxID=2633299 RepID=UPI00137AED64
MFYYDTSIIILIPAMIFALWAQAAVKSNFSRYSKVRNQIGLTGAQAARRVLDANGLYDVQIQQIKGSLTDNYNPRNRTLNLSQDVYGVGSIAAVSVACHEAGHALQHAGGYVPLKVRNGIVPVVNLVSHLTWPLILIGIILLGTGNSESWYMGNLLFNIGVIAFVCIVAFHLITLPVEFNASNRAIDQMQELGLVAQDDLRGSKKVLRAAAMTYVAALAVAVANLLRILAIRGRRD